MNKPHTRIYHQGTSIYVIGTEDIQEACRVADIAPETHERSSTSYGHVVRRKIGWQFRGPEVLPKNARPAVAFIGPIHHRELETRVNRGYLRERGIRLSTRQE